MRITLSIFCILLLFGSLPIAMGDDGIEHEDIGIDEQENSHEDEYRERVEVKTRSDGAIVETRTRAREVDGEIRVESKSRVRDGETDHRTELKTRNGTMEYRERIRVKTEAARERHDQLRDRFNETRHRIAEARDRFAGCRSDDDSQECDRAREDVRRDGKAHLLHSAELVLNALERLKARIEEGVKINDAHQAELLARIDAQIAEIQNLINRIEALDEQPSAEEIREMAAIIKEASHTARRVLNHGLYASLNAHLGSIIKQTEKLGERLHNAIEKLQANGKDTSELDDLVTKFDLSVESALAEWEDAVEAYRSLDDPEERDTVGQTIRAHIEASKEHLKEARELLREIVQLIKELNNGGLDVIEADVNAEVEA